MLKPSSLGIQYLSECRLVPNSSPVCQENLDVHNPTEYCTNKYGEFQQVC